MLAFPPQVLGLIAFHAELLLEIVSKNVLGYIFLLYNYQVCWANGREITLERSEE